MAARLDRYKVFKLLARGGMANIYLASPMDAINSAELVAIKRIRPDLKGDQKFIRMFLDEVRITRQLNHPNIACLLNWGESKGLPYLVMEFVPGVDIHLVLTKQPLPIHMACQVTAALSRALDYAHEQRDEKGELLGIVHRDVTPHNVMVTFEGQTKLLDFGIALAKVRAERTKTGVLKGKWAYMSPEQIDGKNIDRRSDIFTVGVLLYEMLTGKRAFEGESPAETLTSIAFKDPPAVRAINPNVSPELDYILHTCIAKKPADRYQRAIDIALALDEIGNRYVTPGSETLKGLIHRLFADRYQQVTGVLKEIEGDFQIDEALTPLSDETVVSAAPFLRSSADLESEISEIDVVPRLRPAVEIAFSRAEQAAQAAPALPFMMATQPLPSLDEPFEPEPWEPSVEISADLFAPPQPPIAFAPPPVEDEEEDDDEADPMRAKLLIVLGVLIGLGLGLAFIISLWFLAS
jgi:serine/threonine protein kinase